MRRPRRSGLLDRAVGACCAVLAGAAALYLAVHLLLAIWVPLVIIFGGSLVLTGIVWLIRVRPRGW